MQSCTNAEAGGFTKSNHSFLNFKGKIELW